MTIAELYTSKFDEYVKRFTRRANGLHNAEDIVQNAFELALKYEKSFNPQKGNIEQWFSTIMNNEFKRFMKVERDHGMGRVEEELEDIVEEPRLISKKFSKMFKKNSEKEIFDLLLKGYTPPDISFLTGRNLQTVYTIIDRARRKAAEKIANEVE